MSEDSDQESKTEDPTGKKLSDAREKGQIPRSQEVKTAFILVGMLGALMVCATPTADSLSQLAVVFLDHAGTMPFDSRTLSHVMSTALLKFFAIILLPIGFLAGAALAGNLVQAKSLWSPGALRISFSNLSLMKGWQRLFSKQSVIEMMKSLAKMALIGGLLFHLIKPSLGHVEDYVTMDAGDMAHEMRGFAIRLAMGVTISVAIIAGIDYINQYFSFMKKMRMTKEEVKEEYRQSEGDPLVKGKLKQLRMQKARQRMMANVPKADVIITNPTHYAIALKYDPNSMQAPLCLAKGVDDIAKKIRELADEHDIPRISNPPLARALYPTAEVDAEIPVEHYKAVAEVISFVFRLRSRKGSK